MSNTSTCLSGAGENAPTTSENGAGIATCHPDETIKITAKIIADFADWVRVYGAFAIGFMTPITIYVWFLAVIGLVGGSK